MSNPLKSLGRSRSWSQSNTLRRVQPLLQLPFEPQPEVVEVEQPPPEEEQEEQATAWKIYMVKPPGKADSADSVIYKDIEIAGAAAKEPNGRRKPENNPLVWP